MDIINIIVATKIRCTHESICISYTQTEVYNGTKTVQLKKKKQDKVALILLKCQYKQFRLKSRHTSYASWNQLVYKKLIVIAILI